MQTVEFFFLSAITCAAILWLLIRGDIGNFFLDRVDKPNAMHLRPVPRIGGLAIVSAIAVIFFVLLFPPYLHPTLSGIFIATSLLAVVSLIDDRRSLAPAIRLSAHFLAAVFVVYSLNNTWIFSSDRWTQQFAIWLFCFAAVTLIIVWMTNLYNFMDGANGLAGLMGTIGFGSFAIAAQYGGTADGFSGFGLACAAVSGACFGFLLFNFPRARVFLGDCGSIPLGFLAASLGLFGWGNEFWPWYFPPLLFSPFIVDASVTLLTRIFRRQRIWEAHRQHYYHRLILVLGWSHEKTCAFYSLIMIFTALHGLWAISVWRTDRSGGWAELALPPFIIGAWVLIYALLLVGMEWRFSKKNNKSSDKKNAK